MLHATITTQVFRGDSKNTDLYWDEFWFDMTISYPEDMIHLYDTNETLCIWTDLEDKEEAEAIDCQLDDECKLGETQGKWTVHYSWKDSEGKWAHGYIKEFDDLQKLAKFFVSDDVKVGHIKSIDQAVLKEKKRIARRNSPEVMENLTTCIECNQMPTLNTVCRFCRAEMENGCSML